VRGTTVDAEPMRQESAGRADLPAALYAGRNGDERDFGALYRRNRALDFLRVPFLGNPRP
jgi:hypothetical protein